MNILQPQLSDSAELSLTFDEFLASLSQYYTLEELSEFRSYHTVWELEEKLSDPSRFFRIVRNEHGEIIACFESKQGSIPSMQRVQWFFVLPRHQQKGILKILFQEFEEWCKINNYNIIWSIAALENRVSIKTHWALWFIETGVSKKGYQEFLKNLQ